MSGKISGLVWDMDLPTAEKFVALALADHADHEGYGVRPSYDLIAWKTQYSRRYVIDVVAILETKGIVVLDKQGGPDPAGNKANEWHFDLDAIAKYTRPPRKPKPVKQQGSEPQFTTVVNPSSPQTSVQTSNKDSIAPEAAQGDATPKKSRPRDLVFDAIAKGAFGLDNVPDGKGGRIGKLTRNVLMILYPDSKPTPEERAQLGTDLAAMYLWYAIKHADLSPPAHEVTICKYLKEWRVAVSPPKPQFVEVVVPHEPYIAPCAAT